MSIDNDHLRQEAEDSYTLKEGKDYVWVRVGPIDVYIKRNDDNVSVDLYASPMMAKGLIPDDCNIGHTHAGYEEAEFDEGIELEGPPN